MISRHYLATLYKDSRGTTAVEYGLIAALIVMVMLGAMSAFARETITLWNTVSDKSAEAINHDSP